MTPDDGCLVVDESITTMFQEGAVQSSVPGNFQEDSVTLAGLEASWQPFLALLRVANHNLASKLGVSSSILLHSPSKGESFDLKFR